MGAGEKQEEEAAAATRQAFTDVDNGGEEEEQQQQQRLFRRGDEATQEDVFKADVQEERIQVSIGWSLGRDFKLCAWRAFFLLYPFLFLLLLLLLLLLIECYFKRELVKRGWIQYARSTHLNRVESSRTEPTHRGARHCR